MKLNTNQKSVRLSVREFAEFKDAPTQGGTPGYTLRAAIGTKWHHILEKQTKARNPNACFEQSIKGHWAYGDWIFELHGRIDQWEEDRELIHLTEVKSTSTQLPLSDEELLEHYPHYAVQLACYLQLTKDQNVSHAVDGKLQFVEVSTGIQQSVCLPREAKDYLVQQAKAWIPYLENRWHKQKTRESIQLSAPFESWREEQTDARQQLKWVGEQKQHVLWEAPTGFGKTAVILDYALNAVKEGKFDRVLYTSGKISGQQPVVEHLERMLPQEESFKYFRMRNRSEHEVESPLLATPPTAYEISERWALSGESALGLYQGHSVNHENLLERGARIGIPPYWMSCACLKYSDIWVGDYNYAFAPQAMHIFGEQPDFDPTRTLLVIDEAHNLHDRILNAYTVQVDTYSAELASDALKAKGCHKNLLTNLKQWIDWLNTLKKCDNHPAQILYEADDACSLLIEAINENPPNYRETDDATLETLRSIMGLYRLLKDSDLNLFLDSSSDGALSVKPLDVRKKLSEVLYSYKQVVFMSATLSPIDAFIEASGLNKETTVHFSSHPEWYYKAFNIAIDSRVDTRLKERERYAETTTETIELLSENSEKPIVVYFPSFKYAELIHRYLAEKNPLLSSTLQPRHLSFDEQETFIQDALFCSRVLFLVMGGRFAEGVDQLGGRVNTAMIISTALPEVNRYNTTRSDDITGTKQQKFLQVYQIPGMRKIQQAIGRLVRQPDHRANILLHCTRFTDAFYTEQLQPYDNIFYINDHMTLQKWANTLQQ